MTEEASVLWREFWIFWGVAALLAALLILSDFRVFRFTVGGSTTSFVFWAVRESVELALAVGVGLFVAHRVGLGAPILQGWLKNTPARIHWRTFWMLPLIAGVFVGALWNMPELGALNPNRDAITRQVNQFVASPAGKAALREANSELQAADVPTLRVRRIQFVLSWASDALDRELLWDLGCLSLIAFLLVKLASRKSANPGMAVLLTALLATTAIYASYHLYFSVEHWSHPAALDLSIPNLIREPLWSVVARSLIQTVPAGIVFGWLYIRRGLESALFANFVASLAAHLLLVYVFVQFF